jgi:hypothetical protein
VSLVSDEGVPLEVISQLVGHRSTIVTETVYRKRLRPVIEGWPMSWTAFSSLAVTRCIVTQLVPS